MKELIFILMAVSGISFGMLVSAGVLTVFVSVGLIPRFAQKTNTASHILLYENMIILGTIVGGIVTVFSSFLSVPGGAGGLGLLLLFLYGLFGGMFEGCVALAIAEMLDSIPIFARRTGFHRGLRIFVAAVALGKVAGSLSYFFYELYQYGGN
ncbi:MAG: stage V sporulation protein AB [Lachnospiraceae bacterium]|nr:stage V sporulation protein AB [Lachnospiraceae bacterium]